MTQYTFDWDAVPKLERLLSPDEIYDHADETLIRRLAEDKRIERKPHALQARHIAEYVCMWANTRHDGGLIVLGQGDGGDFDGCNQMSAEQINEAEKACHTFCPDADCVAASPKRIPVVNKDGQPDFVLLYRVKYRPDRVVKTTSGKVFVRIGDSKVELKSAAEIRELQAEKGEISFESQDCGLRFPDDFNTTSVSKYVAAVRASRRLSDALSTQEILEVRHLGRICNGEFLPNVACALLFAKDPLQVVFGCKIRFQRFEGEEELTGEKYNAVKDVILEGTVPELIRQLEDALESQLRTFSPLNAKGKFYPAPEYPKDAWYEAVVNACVHRSYGNGMKNMVVFVKMFDDHLVVESPGPFPPYVTPQNIYGMHHPRNPKLMDAMFYLEYVKCAHEGTRRIRDSMAVAELPEPVFKQDDIGHHVVRVTLRNNIKQRRVWIDHDVSKIISEAIAADLTEEEKQALNWAAVNERMTVTDANKLGKKSWQTTRKMLIGLAKKRVLQYIRKKPHKKNVRDSDAFFRLRSNEPIPEGWYEVTEFDQEDE